jgi:hypothetical protein
MSNKPLWEKNRRALKDFLEYRKLKEQENKILEEALEEMDYEDDIVDVEDLGQIISKHNNKIDF